MRIDCLGTFCPIPLIQLKKALPEIRRGAEVMLVTDHSCTCQEIKNYCAELELYCEEEEPVNGVWELRIGMKDK